MQQEDFWLMSILIKRDIWGVVLKMNTFPSACFLCVNTKIVSSLGAETCLSTLYDWQLTLPKPLLLLQDLEKESDTPLQQVSIEEILEVQRVEQQAKQESEKLKVQALKERGLSIPRADTLDEY